MKYIIRIYRDGYYNNLSDGNTKNMAQNNTAATDTKM